MTLGTLRKFVASLQDLPDEVPLVLLAEDGDTTIPILEATANPDHITFYPANITSWDSER